MAVGITCPYELLSFEASVVARKSGGGGAGRVEEAFGLPRPVFCSEIGFFPSGILQLISYFILITVAASCNR